MQINYFRMTSFSVDNVQFVVDSNCSLVHQTEADILKFHCKAYRYMHSSVVKSTTNVDGRCETSRLLDL
jgi:hypothetical protein